MPAYTCSTVFSVSGAGDVNGDGTDDVIVGSPTFTKITAITSGTLSLGVGVTGAAFIYYGANAVGPATTPSQVLQPTGLATGALFGYSVSTAGKLRWQHHPVGSRGRRARRRYHGFYLRNSYTGRSW